MTSTTEDTKPREATRVTLRIAPFDRLLLTTYEPGEDGPKARFDVTERDGSEVVYCEECHAFHYLDDVKALTGDLADAECVPGHYLWTSDMWTADVPEYDYERECVRFMDDWWDAMDDWCKGVTGHAIPRRHEWDGDWFVDSVVLGPGVALEADPKAMKIRVTADGRNVCYMPDTMYLEAVKAANGIGIRGYASRRW